MQTIDLECPSCAELLELDAGFAGGVCRCSNCGTLMTVPSDAGQAEQLTSPGEDMSGTNASAPAPERPSSKRKSAKSKKRGKKKPTSTTVEAGEYRTQTGKVIKIDAPTRVPMAASKKKQIRIVTGVVFFAIVAAVVAVAVIAIVSMAGGGDGTDGEGDGDGTNANGIVEGGPVEPEYIEGANPYLLDFPNIAGIPMDGTVALVVEASFASSRWMPEVSDMLLAGIKRGEDEDARVGFFAAIKGEPVQWAGEDTDPVGDVDPSEMAGWFAELPKKELSKKIDFGWAVTEALKTEPDAIVFVASGLSMDQIEAIESALKDDEGVKVHFVLINSFNVDVEKIHETHGGVRADLTTQLVDEWKDDASDD